MSHRSLLLSLIALLISSAPLAAQTFQSAWPEDVERTWVGPDCWANRLQDWRIAGGRLECLEGTAAKPMRTVHLLTRRLGATEGDLAMGVRLGLIEPDGAAPPQAGAGFLIGAGPDVDYRAAALVHSASGPGGGLFAGIDGAGHLFFRDNTAPGGKGAAPEVPSTAGPALPRDQWKIVSADSAEKDMPPANAIDGDPATYWHTEYKAVRKMPPHELQIDLGKAVDVAGLRILWRASAPNGRIGKYEFYVSADGKDWGKPVAQGTFSATEAESQVLFEPKTGRYVRLVALTETAGRPPTVIAELNLLDAALAKAAASAGPAAPAVKAGPSKDVELRLSAKPVGGTYTLTLTSHDPATGKELASLALNGVAPDRLVGNVALVSNPAGGKNVRFWFKDWKVAGSKVEAHEERTAGPILTAQYTLSGGVLKMTAQMMPLGAADTQEVRLEIPKDGAWKTAATTNILVPGWTAPFRVEPWDATQDTPYRVAYDLKQPGGETRTVTWGGTLRHDPVEKPVIVIAGFTGNHNVAGGVEGARFPWDHEHVWFPHNEVVKHVAEHDPDVLFFSGDQVYEGASPTGVDKNNLELDYMYKWYLWCWAFADLVRDRPCVSTPDDHDVYQGNLWGGGGRPTEKDDKGGYVHPAAFVKMVERTQTSHLPDPFDPTPVEQKIGVYYCAMTYGRISFAVIEDRKFKSGPNSLVPPTGTGRADWVADPNFDPKTADVPGAEMLGPRQEKFLRQWAADWRGADMKIELSQTVYAGVASLHGAGRTRLTADYDSDGWPQAARNRALDALRRGFAFMLNGDQHLSTIVHHGIDDWNDAGWSMCVPSIANFYPRTWAPLVPGKNRVPGMPDYTGEFLDGFGNHVTVWAATNPGTPQGHDPALLHDRMPGYSIIRMNKADQTITIECWPRYADPKDPKTGHQYPGWPKTIAMEDNYGRKAAAYLPTLQIKGMDRPVVQVIDEKDGQVVYTLRIKDATFRPKVFHEGTYTVIVGEQGTARLKTLKGVAALPPNEAKTLTVEF